MLAIRFPRKTKTFKWTSNNFKVLFSKDHVPDIKEVEALLYIVFYSQETIKNVTGNCLCQWFWYLKKC